MASNTFELNTERVTVTHTSLFVGGDVTVARQSSADQQVHWFTLHFERSEVTVHGSADDLRSVIAALAAVQASWEREHPTTVTAAVMAS